MTIVNGNPTFSTYTYKDTNSKVTNLLGSDQLLVKGLSNLQITILATNKMITKKKATAYYQFTKTTFYAKCCLIFKVI